MFFPFFRRRFERRHLPQGEGGLGRFGAGTNCCVFTETDKSCVAVLVLKQRCSSGCPEFVLPIHFRDTGLSPIRPLAFLRDYRHAGGALGREVADAGGGFAKVDDERT